MADNQGVESLGCGRLVRAAEPRLADPRVVAAYRLRFDSSSEGALDGVRGALEGLVVRTCEPLV